MLDKDKIYNELYEKIIRNIDNIIFEHLLQYDNKIENDNFTIKIYKRDNIEDRSYLAKNAQTILDFMNAGYLRSTGNSFAGFQSCKDLRTKCVEAKIAYTKNTEEIIAISLYNSYLCGKKCIGITVTDNDILRQLGKEAIKEIIKFDISHHKLFYWCECSGTIEHYYEKYNGFKIPNIYVSEIFNNKQLSNINLDDDGYHYSRTIQLSDGDSKTLTKVIYGFKSEELFNKMLADHYNEVDNWLKSFDNSINESNDYIHLSDIEKAFYIIDGFGELFIHEGYKDFTTNTFNTIKNYIQYLKNEYISDNYYNKYSKEDIKDEYELAEDYLDISSELIIHEL